MRKILFLLLAMTAFAIEASAQTVTMGDTAILPGLDGGNGNLLVAQRGSLTQSAQIQSMSFYVWQADGNLILGIYDATGANGRPGKLVAQTAEFTPTVGWNVASTTTNPTLPAGKYWLAYLPSSDTLGFNKENNTGPCWYRSTAFSSMLPAAFGTSGLTNCTPTTWSFYATLTTAIGPPPPPTLGLTDSPVNPSVMATATIGTVVTSLTASWSDHSQFTGSYLFVAPNNDDGGLFSLNNNQVVLNGDLSNDGGSTQNVSVQAQQGSTSSNVINVPIAVASTPPPPPPPPPGDPTAGLLPPDRDAYANWKMAGLQSVGGIPNRTTICATVSPSGGDDMSVVQNAIDACPVGEVVELTAGAFLFQEGNSAQINKGITVRGAGACAGTGVGQAPYPATVKSCTLVHRTNGASIGVQGGSVLSPHFIMGPNIFDNSLSTKVALTADAQQGSYTIQVDSTTGFSVGQVVLLAEEGNLGWQPDWAFGGQVWADPNYKITGSAHNPCQPGADQYCGNPPAVPNYFCFGNGVNCDYYVNENKQIAAINGNTITFDSPVMVNYRTGHNAILAAYTQQFTTYAGLESMTLQNADYGDVVMNVCAYCWVKNVEDTVSAQGTIDIASSFRDQFSGLYDHMGAYPYIGGGGYNWTIDAGSSELLFENSITMQNDKVMVMREGGGGSVFAYNYADMGFCADGGCGDYAGSGFVAIESGMNASHWMGTHHTLFEGNWTFNISGDGTWGSDPFNTFFGNYAPGFRSKFTDYINHTVIDDANNLPGGNSPLRAASLAAYHYWNSFIANVLGVPGKTTAANGWNYTSYIQSNDKAIFFLGALDQASGGEGGDPEVLGQQSPVPAACVSPSGDPCPAVRHGNYDYLNNAVVWDSNNSDHTLPPSFYLSSPPAYFNAGSGYAWPWVTPTGSPQLQSGPTTTACGGPCSGLPAKARVDNGTPFTQP